MAAERKLTEAWEIEPGTICANCKERPATDRFAENHSAMDFAHGFYGQPWCATCIKRRQLAYARERAAAIPRLERELAASEQTNEGS